MRKWMLNARYRTLLASYPTQLSRLRRIRLYFYRKGWTLTSKSALINKSGCNELLLSVCKWQETNLHLTMVKGQRISSYRQAVPNNEREQHSIILQWNLWAEDTLGPTIVSIAEKLFSFRRFQNALLQWEELLLGHYEVSFVRGCPFLGGSFIERFTVLPNCLTENYICIELLSLSQDNYNSHNIM